MSTLQCLLIFFTGFFSIGALLLSYILSFTNYSQTINTANQMRLQAFLFQMFLYLIGFGFSFFITNRKHAMILIIWLTMAQLFIFGAVEIYAQEYQGIIHSNRVKHQKLDPIFEIAVQAYLEMYFNFSIYCLPMLILSVVSFTAISVQECQRQKRINQAMEQLMSVEFAEQIPAEPSRMVQEKSICSICLLELETSKTCKLHCQHWFHKECMIDWIKVNQICPLCRVQLTGFHMQNH